jgi:hypothetical protein
MINDMTETVEHPTTPTTTVDPPARTRTESNGLYRVLAWVGIVAGVVFIVAVVFFSGFFLGKHSGGGFGHGGPHLGGGMHFFHRGGPPGGPMGRMPGGPGGPSNVGPGNVGPGVPPVPPPPPVAPPAPRP